MEAPKKRFIFKPGNNNATKTASATANNRPSTAAYQNNTSRPTSVPNPYKEKRNSAMPAFKNQKRGITNLGSNSAKESPAKRTKVAEKTGGDLDIEFGDFDDDIEDDDFSKGLTSDDLTVLELQASQTVSAADTAKASKNGSFSVLHQFDRFLSEQASNSRIIPEKTLELFSTARTECSTIASEFGGKNNNDNFNTERLKQIENELAKYSATVKQLQENAFTKDGEIKILRQSFLKAQEERDEYKLKIQNFQGSLLSEQSDNEIRLKREIEKLKTQLQFKDKEVREAKEAKTRSEQTKSSPIISNSKSPTNRQVLVKKRSPKASPLKKISFEEKNPFNRPSSSKDSADKMVPPESIISKETGSDLKDISDGTTDILKTFLRMNRFMRHSPSAQNHSQIQRDLLADFEKVFDRLQSLNITAAKDDKRSSKNQPNYHPLTKEVISLCRKTIQIEDDVNVFSVLEIIEPNIVRLLSKEPARYGGVDLMCDELGLPSSLPQHVEANDGMGKCLKIDDLVSAELGRISLSILNTVARHSIAVQESLLLALLEDQSTGISTQAMQNQARKSHLKDYHQLFGESSSSILLKVDGISNHPGNTEELMKGHQQRSRVSSYSSDVLVKCIFDLFSHEKDNENIRNQVFQIIVSLATSLTSISKTGLVKKLCECHMLNEMSQYPDQGNILSVMSVFKSLSNYPGIEELFCCNKGICTLQNTYRTLIRLSEGSHDSESEDLKLEIIQTLSTLIASQSGMMKFLLESECECSNQVLKSLVLTLLSEIKIVRETCLDHIEKNTLDECKPFLVLRQGISLLCHICFNDRLFMDHRLDVERQYINLINGTIRLFRKVPSISEFEVIALQDLLDMEQYEELDDVDESPGLDISMETK